MKKILFCLLVSAFLYTPLPAKAFEPERAHVYPMYVPCETNPELVLTKVVVTKGRTYFYLEFTADGWGEVGIHPPGSEYAFFVSDEDTNETYDMLDFYGIPKRPDTLTLNDGETCNFTLIFEDFPLSRLNLLEGRDSAPCENMWYFSGIILSQPDVDGKRTAK